MAMKNLKEFFVPLPANVLNGLQGHTSMNTVDQEIRSDIGVVRAWLMLALVVVLSTEVRVQSPPPHRYCQAIPIKS
jgi:hypothetical protein